MGDATAVLTGRCGCGAVGYEVDDAFAYALNCHCSQCRRRTGAAFKPVAGIARERVRVVAGEARVAIRGEPDGAHDVQCGVCGSLLFSVVRAGAFAHVAMGTLVDAPSIRPSMHIFVGSKAEWFTISDDLPQFEELPPG